MTIVFALLEARPDHVHDVEAALRDLLARTRDEPGALGYAVHRVSDDTFLVHERYVDQAACDAHFATGYVTDFLARTQGWLTAPPRVEFATELARFAR